MSQAHPYNTRSRSTISTIESTTPFQSIRSGQGSGRGRGRGRSGGRGRSRGRGRGFGNRGAGRGRSQTANQYHPYQNATPFVSSYGPFVPEAKVYQDSVFNNFTPYQKREVSQLKTSLGWINANTPPPGYIIDNSNGYAVPAQAAIAALRSNVTIANTNTSMAGSVIPIPPPPPLPPPPPIVNVPSPHRNNVSPTNNVGAHFSRSGSRSSVASATVNTVSINGQPYSGQVYDQYGNPLN